MLKMQCGGVPGCRVVCGGGGYVGSAELGCPVSDQRLCLCADNITIPFAASSCATPNACELKKGEILNSGVFTYTIAQTECYTPSSAQQMLGPVVLGSILPSLAGLLAVKFLS